METKQELKEKLRKEGHFEREEFYRESGYKDLLLARFDGTWADVSDEGFPVLKCARFLDQLAHLLRISTEDRLAVIDGADIHTPAGCRNLVKRMCTLCENRVISKRREFLLLKQQYSKLMEENGRALPEDTEDGEEGCTIS